MVRFKRLVFFVYLVFVVSGCSERQTINSLIYYKVDEECVTMGKIEGTTRQNPLVGDYTTEVTAVANKGYVFVKWSDDNTNPTRNDLAAEDVFVTFIAYFEVSNG